MDRPQKIYFEKIFFEKKKSQKKRRFWGGIYQLKNTSDCIKTDPPCPGRNKKKKSPKKNRTQIWCLFLCFCYKNTRFGVIFLGHGCFAAMAAKQPWPLRGRGRLPSVEFSLNKFTGKTVPENYTLFFGENTFFVILLIKKLWDLSRTTDLVEIIRMLFLSKIDWRTLKL